MWWMETDGEGGVDIQRWVGRSREVDGGVGRT